MGTPSVVMATDYTSTASNKAKFDNTEKNDCRARNIIAAKAIADCVRTSLGPRGMDKMVIDSKKDVVITNDGATILKKLQVQSPAARMLVELSKAQDIEAGDGTTTVVVICGALLEAAKELLAHGSHPTRISDAFQRAASEAMKVLDTMAIPFDLKDRDAMIKAAQTSLSSKVINTHSVQMATICADAVQKVADAEKKSS